MLPNTSIQIQSMLRAITEVIIPAIDESAGIAREQAALLTLDLKELLLQCERSFDSSLAELRDVLALHDRLPFLGEEDADIAEARRITQLDIPPQSRVNDLTQRLKDVVDQRSREALAGDAQLRSIAAAAIVAYSEHQVARRAAWHTRGEVLPAWKG